MQVFDIWNSLFLLLRCFFSFYFAASKYRKQEKEYRIENSWTRLQVLISALLPSAPWRHASRLNHFVLTAHARLEISFFHSRYLVHAMSHSKFFHFFRRTFIPVCRIRSLSVFARMVVFIRSRGSCGSELLGYVDSSLCAAFNFAVFPVLPKRSEKGG